MLKVKKIYQRVIRFIHPDKVGTLSMESKLLLEGIFIVLQEKYDCFRKAFDLN
jgi:hypothetical protein